MPDDQDRVLAQLAVEAGFLTREEAGGYWQRLHAPGSPRLIHLLLQEGRISQPQIEQLRVRYMSMQQLQSAVIASSPTVIDEEESAAAGNASETVLEPPTDSWEEDLQKDALLAKALLEQGASTLERLREARQLQLQHRMRLGVVLVKLGYVDRMVVEQAIGAVRDQLGGRPAVTAEQYQAAQTQFDAPQGLPGNMDEQPTVLDGPVGPGAQSPTVLNDPNARPLAPGEFDPFSSVSTGRSVEELNPFAMIPGPKKTGGQNHGGFYNNAPVDSHTDIPMPGQHRQPLPSVDELDAFTDMPLPPPPSPGATETVPPPMATGANSPFPPLPDGEPVVPFRSSGFTPTGVPIGGEIETGSTRLKAREKANLQRKQAKKKRARKKSSNFSLLVILMLAGGLAIAGGLYAIIAYMDL